MKGDICTIDKCTQPVRTNGVCRGHNWRMKAYGSYEKPSSRRHGDRCKVDGCRNSRDLQQRSSLCTMHRVRMSRHGSIELPKKDKIELPEGILKICIHHGALTEKDVCKISNTNRFNCRICRTLTNEKLRDSRPTGYKNKRNFIFIGKKGNYLRLSIIDYEKMLKDQNELCKICNKPETMLSNGKTKVLKRLAIDHCHTTGKVRGLLCHRCNTGIGGFYESIDLLNFAIDYLKKHS